MQKFAIIVLAFAIALGGCAGGNTRKAPSLTVTPAPPPGPPPRNYLKEASDTTWKVVTAPARLVSPQPKPKVTPAEPIEPPSAIMSQRNYAADEIPMEEAPVRPVH